MLLSFNSIIKIYLNTLLFADEQVIIQDSEHKLQISVYILTFRHRASSI